MCVRVRVRVSVRVRVRVRVCVCVCKSVDTISNFLTHFFICLWFSFCILMQSTSIRSLVRHIVPVPCFIGTEHSFTVRQS